MKPCEVLWCSSIRRDLIAPKVASCLIKSDTPSLDLEDEHTFVWVRYDKIGLTVVRAAEFVVTDPLNVMKVHLLIT